MITRKHAQGDINELSLILRHLKQENLDKQERHLELKSENGLIPCN